LEQKIDNIKNEAPMVVSKGIQEEFANYFLKEKTTCSQCGGTLILKISRFGAIVGCQNYPECKEIFNIDQGEKPTEQENAKILNGIEILIKNGPYGPYIEYKENEKPKRIPIPKPWQDEEMSNEKIQFLASLPKEIGIYNDKKITLSIGRFGPFVKYDNLFVSIKTPMELNLEQAIQAIENKINKPEKTNTKFKKK
jgi:DNA topoisomerase-1